MNRKVNLNSTVATERGAVNVIIDATTLDLDGK